MTEASQPHIRGGNTPCIVMQKFAVKVRVRILKALAFGTAVTGERVG